MHRTANPRMPVQFRPGPPTPHFSSIECPRIGPRRLPARSSSGTRRSRPASAGQAAAPALSASCFSLPKSCLSAVPRGGGFGNDGRSLPESRVVHRILIRGAESVIASRSGRSHTVFSRQGLKRNQHMVWDEETIRHLKDLWAQGHSTAEIGRRLGVSKNAIVGKAHRLDLDARPSPIRRDAAKPVVERPSPYPANGGTDPAAAGQRGRSSRYRHRRRRRTSRCCVRPRLPVPGRSWRRHRS